MTNATQLNGGSDQLAMHAMPVSSDIDLRKLRARISEKMAERRINTRTATRQAGLSTTAIYDILNGKNKNPSIPVIKRIARVLQTSAEYLCGDIDSETQSLQTLEGAAPIPVAGIAEAGAFRAMPEWGHEHEHELPRIIAPRSKLYPKAKHFALEVRGDSMNAAKPTPIVEGMYVLCIDVIDAGADVESGRIYAVRRTMDGGQTYECTIKRAKVFRDRVELHPESTNHSHKVIEIPRRHDREAANSVEAIGLVYGSFNSFEL
jgi:SOS-response transcriptional repressor LexA